MEGGCGSGLAGGGHGDAHVHPSLLGEHQKWQGALQATLLCFEVPLNGSVWIKVSVSQVLLLLTDEDLELGLGISDPIHRRKLRLAIEDYRRAEGEQW